RLPGGRLHVRHRRHRVPHDVRDPAVRDDLRRPRPDGAAADPDTLDRERGLPRVLVGRRPARARRRARLAHVDRQPARAPAVGPDGPRPAADRTAHHEDRDRALRAHAGDHAQERRTGHGRARGRRRHDDQPGDRAGRGAAGRRREARRHHRGRDAGAGALPGAGDPHGAGRRRDRPARGHAAQGRRDIRDRRRDRSQARAAAARARDHLQHGGTGGIHRRRYDAGDFLHQRDSAVRRGVLDQRGFTLIELLVVIIVLGLLVGLVGPRLFGRVGQSKQAAARAQIELLGAALDQSRLDIGSYPSGGQGLEALQRNPNVNNWNGPYLKKAVPKDPWGNQYKYRCRPGQNGEYDLWSEGADGAPGGDGENADITSWDNSQK